MTEQRIGISAHRPLSPLKIHDSFKLVSGFTPLRQLTLGPNTSPNLRLISFAQTTRNWQPKIKYGKRHDVLKDVSDFLCFERRQRPIDRYIN